MGTAFDGSLALALEPSLLQKLDEPSPLTSANLNSPLPLKLTPSTATRPSKLINCGTCACVAARQLSQTVRESPPTFFMPSLLLFAQPLLEAAFGNRKRGGAQGFFSP